MLKKNKKFFIASCIVILLPMFAGFLLWDQLPAQVATHFGRNGEADRYSSKLFAVAGIYLFLLAVHILCSVITEFDPKKRNVGSKIYHLILCICPVVSLWCGVMIYGNALGYKDVINLNLWTNCFTRNSSDRCWKLSSKVQTELYDRNQTSMDIG